MGRWREQLPLLLGLGVSIAIHSCVLIPILGGAFSGGMDALTISLPAGADPETPPPAPLPAPPEDPNHPLPTTDTEQVVLGIDNGTDKPTVTWIGYDQYQEHLARLAEVEQAAFRMTDEGGGSPAAAPNGALSQPSAAIPPHPDSPPPTVARPAATADAGQQTPPRPPAPPITKAPNPAPLAMDRDPSKTPPAPQPPAAAPPKAPPALTLPVPDKAPEPTPAPIPDAAPLPAPPPEHKPPEPEPIVRPAPDDGPKDSPEPIEPPKPEKDPPPQESPDPREGPPTGPDIPKPPETPKPEELPKPPDADPTPEPSPPESKPQVVPTPRPPGESAPDNPNPQPAAPPAPPPSPGSTPQPADAPGSPTKPAATPGPPATGDRSDRESDPTSTVDVPADKWQNGKPLAAKGLQIKTRRPEVLPEYLAVQMSPGRNPSFELQFNSKGVVTKVELLSSCGASAIDDRLIDCLYRWRADGAKLKTMKPDDTLRFRLRLLVR